MEVVRKLFFDYFLLFLVFQLLFVTFTRMIGIEKYHYLTITPAYIYWYLFAMFIWNLVLKLAVLVLERMKIKMEIVIGLSVLLGLVAGYFDFISWEMSLSRIIVLFPYFILGYYCKEKGIRVKHIISNKVVAGTILFGGIVLAYARHDIFDFHLLSCAVSYHQMGIGSFGIIYRFLLYMVQIAMLLSFFSLVPYKKSAFTKIGKNTLSIYVFHGFIVKALVEASYFDEFSIGKVIVSPLLAFILVLVLSKIPLNLHWLSLRKESLFL